MAKVPSIIEPIDADFDDIADNLMSSTTLSFATPEIPEQSDFLFYSSGNGADKIRVFVAHEDVWVTQSAMTEIFGIDKSGVSRHLKNIFDSGELVKDRTVAKIATVLPNGRTYKVEHYNLDAILSVGYRANSRKAIQFRQWASSILREYLVKGFAMDDARLKQGSQLFEKDYFDELLERIRDIRASERRFYQKVTEIYIQCSHDYDASSDLTKKFFSHTQNKLEYAVTGMTAAEIVKLRADHNLPNMGLTTWANQGSGGKIRKSDVSVAKNYLTEDEVSDLNRLVTMFLDYAENLAQKGRRMAMKDWHSKLDDFLNFNEYQILRGYGRVKKTTADKTAAVEFTKFKPIQDDSYKSDFDKAIETIKSTGALP